MNFISVRLYLLITILTISLLVGCNGENANNINQINTNPKLYNKNRFSNNSRGAAAATIYEGKGGNIKVYRGSSGTFIVFVGDSRYEIAFPPGFFPEGAQISHVVPLIDPYDSGYIQFLVSLVNSPTVYLGEIDVDDYIDGTPILVKYMEERSARNAIIDIVEGRRLTIYIDISNIYINGVDDLERIYTAPEGYTIIGVEYDFELRRYKVSMKSYRMGDSIVYLWFDDDGRFVNETLANLPGFPGNDIQSHGIFGGAGSADAVYIPPVASGITQAIAICPNTESGTCSLTQLDSENPITNVVSNFAYVESPPSVLALTSSGQVFKLNQDKAKNAYIWEQTSALNMNMGSNSSFYSAYNGMFYAIGISTRSNNLGDTVLEASENGRFWEDTNVYSFRSIAATPNSYCAIENDASDPLGFGQVSCWGSNSENKLGLGNLESSSPVRALIPAKIGIAQGETSPISYLSLAGGSYHMCALRTSLDKVDCWGHSGYGELGDGHNYDPNSSTPIATPVAIPNISGKIRALVGGGSHSCILDTKGQAWCWGSNQYGEINTTNTVTKYTSPTFAYYNSPFHYLSIAAGRDFTCATTATQVNCWGNNYSYPFKSMQISLSQDSNFTAISAGGGNACVLSNKVHSGNTNAWCWGDNSYGQLGNGESGGFSYTPQPVISKSDPIIFNSISQSGVTTCAIESGTGHTYCWGNNQALQTGIPDKRIVVTPDLAIKLNGKPGVFSNVSEGILSTCLISNETNESGSIIHNTYCLGSNSLGQLGVGSTNNESQPVLVNKVIFGDKNDNNI